MATTFVKVRPMSTTKEAFSKGNSSTWNHKEPMTSDSGDTSPNATQGSAIESNFAPGNYGDWLDISASPWLYHLFKAERTTDGKLDPRLY
jgi:SusD family.